MSAEERHYPPPARTPEEREDQMINLAINLAEQQLRDGTATAQVITHYLKLGSTMNRLEKAVLAKKKELMDAQIAAYNSSQNAEAMYAEALSAFREYRGEVVDEQKN